MSTYVIGDIQGCFDPFMRLLEKVKFDSTQDCLWLTGDLVNRGPASLAVLRFVKSLKYTQVVLGNHDLHCLSVLYGQANLDKQDTLGSLVTASDKEELAMWLRHKPLLHHDVDLGITLVHAGLPPQWNLTQALQCAHELQQVLTGKNYLEFFANMYRKAPSQWSDNLTGWERLNVIANCFTRLRYCDVAGNLDLSNKTNIAKKNYFPWFKVPHRRSKNLKIVFGHWSALKGKTDDPNSIALDTGCVWGNCLTALCLETGKKFSVNC